MKEQQKIKPTPLDNVYGKKQQPLKPTPPPPSPKPPSRPIIQRPIKPPAPQPKPPTPSKKIGWEKIEWLMYLIVIATTSRLKDLFKYFSFLLAFKRYF